jgi:imidazolonepropionase-like amidohydrolase
MVAHMLGSLGAPLARALCRPARVALLGLLCACSPPKARSEPVVPIPPRLPWQAEPVAPTPPRSPAVALVGATLMTGTGAEIEDAAITFSDGRILAVGPRASVPVPEGATVVDLSGHFVTPGLIDAHSHMGVYGAPQVSANSDGNEATRPVTAEVRAADSFWPQDPALSHALAAGITTILVLPGSANLVGGQGVTVKLHPGRSVADMQFPGAPATLKMACGENPKRVYGDRRMAPSTRMGNVAGYRDAFRKALEYRAKFTDWQGRHQSWQKKREPGATAPADPAPAMPDRDFGLETLLGAIEGRVLLEIHCYRADEMLGMLSLAEEFGFTVRAFHHAVEAYKIRDVLAARGVAVATWADWWGFKLEAYDTVRENLALLTESGVRGVLHSDSSSLVQRLNQEAAKSITAGKRAGLSIERGAALKWITSNPAWVLGVEDQTGSLEPGKMADVVVWSGDPFSVYSFVERVYVDGVELYDRDMGGRRPSDFELGQGAELPRPERRPARKATGAAPAGGAHPPPASGSSPTTLPPGTTPAGSPGSSPGAPPEGPAGSPPANGPATPPGVTPPGGVAPNPPSPAPAPQNSGPAGPPGAAPTGPAPAPPPSARRARPEGKR